jgi:hypothetical protein
MEVARILHATMEQTGHVSLQQVPVVADVQVAMT